MYFKQEKVISTLRSKPLKLTVQLTYVGSNISATERDISIRIDRLPFIEKSNLFDKIQRDFFQAVAVSVLLSECITRTLTKHIEKKASWKLLENATGSNVLKNCGCTTTYLPSHKHSKQDEQDMLNIAGEIRTNS